MTTTGIILWSLVIVFLILGLLRKGKSVDTDGDNTHDETVTKKHRGGCCG